MAVMLIFLIVAIRAFPYVDQLDNKVDLVGKVVLTLTPLCAIFAILNPSIDIVMAVL